MDRGLPAELGVDRLHRQAVRLLAAVAAPLAHPLVDEDAGQRVDHLAALAQPPLLRRAVLVVDQHGDAADGREQGLRLEQPVAMPDLRVARDRDPRVLGGIVARDDDALDAFGLEAPAERGDGQGARRVLAAGHRHRAVVEDLVGDVHAGGHRVVQREAARVEERPVADVLEQVWRLGERRDADPLRALRAHVGDPDDAAVHPHRHAVTADARGGHAALGHHGGAVVRAARAEEGGAGQGQRLRPALELVEVLDARLHRVDLDPASEAPGDRPRDGIGVELADRRQQRPVLLVELAHHLRPVGHAVEDVLAEHLEEGALLLDHEDLLQAAPELAHDARLHREQHADLEDADAVAAQRSVVEAELGEGLADVVVGLAARDDAEPRVRRRHRDAVELVLVRVAPGQLEAREVKRALHVEAVGRDQVHIDLVLEGLAVQLDHRDDRVHPLRIHLGGARLVRHVGDDLGAHPEAGRAREHEAVQAEIQDLLHVARVERGHQRVVERDLGVAGQGRRLGQWIVPGQREHAAVLAHARVVGVLEDVAGPVHARGLAVPHAEHAVEPGLREEAGHLAAVHRGRAQILVEPGGEHHVVCPEQRGHPLERLVEPAEGRAPVARDERRRLEAAPDIGAMLIQGEPDQRLDAGQVHPSALLGVLGLEREFSGRCGHELPLWGGDVRHRTTAI